MDDMDKFVIITEIQNLFINTSVSMCIEGPKKDYYFYSKNFIKKLSELNKIIKQIKYNDLPNSHSFSINEIIKVKDSSAFIIFEQELEISLNVKELFKFIEDLINPLINIAFLYPI